MCRNVLIVSRDNHFMPQEYAQQDDSLLIQQAQQQPVDPVNALYSDTLREEKLNTILQQINPDNLMVDIENRIKGYRKDSFSQEWIKIDSRAKEINPQLVANFMSFLGSILNQNTSMSNFSSSEINAIMENIIEHIADDLETNDIKYEIEGDYSEMTRIGDIIAMTVFSVLKRAQNGMEARRVFASLKIHENLTQNPQQKGLMDSMKFWK